MTNDYEIREVTDGSARSAIARSILASVPQWFGRPEATEMYIKAAAGFPMLAVFASGSAPAGSGGGSPADSALGFLSLERKTPVATEAHVLAVRLDQHRRGIGRAMFAAAEASLRQDGMKFLIVRTVAQEPVPSVYDDTRPFYASVGFEQLEFFEPPGAPEIPGLLLIKAL